MRASLAALIGFGVFLQEATLFAQQLPRVDDQLQVSAIDWPWWRGPLRDGTAHPNQDPPLDFGEGRNMLWKAPVPGRGHGSPIVVGERLFLATANEETGAQYLLCYARDSGKQLWQSVIHAEGGMRKNERSTAASSTPACDGERVYINFPNAGKLITSAVTLEGDILWQREIANYVMHQGYGSSPALYQRLVIVSADNKGGGALAALDTQTGEVIWRRERPESPNYPSPILVHVNGKDQIIMVGCDTVVSYAPLTGESLWEVAGATTECVTSTLTDGQLVYTSGGYPRNHMSAIRADGSGELVWENSSRLYVPSLVIHQGYLFGVLDAGIAVCWKADNGQEMWKQRLGGTFSSSPVLVNDTIYVTNESGEFFIFRASPQRFEQLAKNQIGDQVFATPTIADSRIYHRVAMLDGPTIRQEWMYCFSR
jgi:outer membrane protein assembly factor BamB